MGGHCVHPEDSFAYAFFLSFGSRSEPPDPEKSTTSKTPSVTPTVQAPDPPRESLNGFLAGAIAGVLSKCVTAPLDVLKITAQVGTGPTAPPGGILSQFRSVLARRGWRGMFSGNLTNCLRAVPYTGTVTYSYGCILAWLERPTYWERVAAGAAAGGLAAALTHPMDTVRTRLVLQPQRPLYYAGVGDAFRRIAREEGLRGLYRGLRLSCLTVVPFVAIQQSSQDVFRDYCLPHWENSFRTLLSCGFLSAFCAQTATFPLELLKRNLQAADAPYLRGRMGRGRRPLGDMELALGVLREFGWRGLYKGLGVALVKVVPGVGVCLAVRDMLLGRLDEQRDCLSLD